MVDVASDGFLEAPEDLGLPDIFRFQTESLQMRPVVHVDVFVPGRGDPAVGIAFLVLLSAKSLDFYLK